MVIPYVIENEFQLRKKRCTLRVDTFGSKGPLRLRIPAVFQATTMVRQEAMRYCRAHNLFLQISSSACGL